MQKPNPWGPTERPTHEDMEMKTDSSELAGGKADGRVICNIYSPNSYQYKILNNYNTPPLPVVYPVGSIIA